MQTTSIMHANIRPHRIRKNRMMMSKTLNISFSIALFPFWREIFFDHLVCYQRQRRVHHRPIHSRRFAAPAVVRAILAAIPQNRAMPERG
jgi:hypothetical protein